jgi:hypothetical protein
MTVTVRHCSVRAKIARAGGSELVPPGVRGSDDESGPRRRYGRPVGRAGGFDAPQHTTRRRQSRCRPQYQFRPPGRLQNLGAAAEPSQRRTFRINCPRKGQRTAHKAKQHSDEEPAEVRGNPGTERQHNREQRVEGPLSRAEPEQDSAQQQHHRNEVAGQTLDADMYDKRERTLLRKHDLASAADHQESAPEWAGASPDSEATPGCANRTRHAVWPHGPVPVRLAASGRMASPRRTPRSRRAELRQPAVIWPQGFEHPAAYRHLAALA